jgi:hypothetical protein
MSLLSELTRPFWLRGLHAIADHDHATIRAWIRNGTYQIYQPLETDGAVLSFTEASEIVEAYAGDCSRMSIAAFESIEGIHPSPRLPRSMAWMLVRSYYAAFFAAHAVLRVFGRSCTQLDGNSLSSIHEVADLFGQRNGKTLPKSIYSVRANADEGTVQLRRLTSSDGGSHAAVWSELSDLLSELSEKILSGGGARATTQVVSAKLIEIRAATLGFTQTTGWLSSMRNRVNYQLEFGAWFPYRERLPYYDLLFGILDRWKADPMTFSVWPDRGRDLQRFVETTVMLVSFCRAVVEDMAARAPSGRSFHRSGCLALMERLNQ